MSNKTAREINKEFAGRCPDFVGDDIFLKLVTGAEEVDALKKVLESALLENLGKNGLKQIVDTTRVLKPAAEKLNRLRGKSEVEILFDRLPNIYYLTEISRSVNSTLINEWAATLRGYFISLADGDSTNAEDISQQTVYQMIRELRNGGLGDTGNLEAYQKTVGRRVLIDSWRKNGRSAVDSLTDIENQEGGTDKWTGISDNWRGVDQMNEPADMNHYLQKMKAVTNSPEQQEIDRQILIDWLKGLPVKDTAARLDLKTAAVNYRRKIYRAILVKALAAGKK